MSTQVAKADYGYDCKKVGHHEHWVACHHLITTDRWVCCPSTSTASYCCMCDEEWP